MNDETIKISEYFSKRGILFKTTGNEIQTFCLFSNCDAGKQNPALGHLYLNNEKGIYQCKKCGAKGNIFNLADYFGDNYREVYKYPLQKTITPEQIANLGQEIEQLHSNVAPAKDWLLKRGFTEETINKFKLGYVNDAVSIPHFQNGKPVSIKFRKISEKQFWRKEGTPSVLFNTDAVEGNDYCVVVEGEFDAIAGVQAGVKNIVGITVGAETWKEDWTQFFDKFKKIYLCLDSDLVGQQGALKIADKLGVDRCFNVVLPVKDLNDFLLSEHKQEELKTLFANARQFPGARKISSANDILEMTESEQPFLLDGMIVENSVNALTADSGKGKSLIALKMIEAIVRGEKFLGEFKTKKTKTLILDLEMSANDIIDRVKTIIQNRIDGLDFYHCQTFNIEDEKDFEWLIYSIERNKYGLIVFDTLSGIHEREENSNSEMNLVNKKLIELCNKHGQTVLFLHHHKKPQKGDVQNQASSRGAGAIIDKSASHLLLDSKECIVAIGENTKVGVSGLKVTIEQMKKRQRKKCERYAINVWNNPETKKTVFEFAGLDEKPENALEKTKSLILGTMKEGQEYIMAEIKKLVGKSSNIYTAIKELGNEGAINIRDLGEEEAKERKLKKNAKIYSLT